MKAILLAVALCAMQFVSAQIRIISQDKVRKATELARANNFPLRITIENE